MSPFSHTSFLFKTFICVVWSVVHDDYAYCGVLVHASDTPRFLLYSLPLISWSPLFLQNIYLLVSSYPSVPHSPSVCNDLRRHNASVVRWREAGNMVLWCDKVPGCCRTARETREAHTMPTCPQVTVVQHRSVGQRDSTRPRPDGSWQSQGFTMLLRTPRNLKLMKGLFPEYYT